MLNHKLQVLLNTINKLLRKNAHRRLLGIVDKIHLADLAVVFRFLNEEQQNTIFLLLQTTEKQAEFLEELDDNIAEFLISDLSVKDIAELISLMSNDEATDLIQDMDTEKANQILALLKKDDREDIEDLIKYDEETAGGLMTTDFLSVSSNKTAKEALDLVQESGDEAETVFYLYVVDSDERLEGVVSLREVVQADDDELLNDIMETDIHKARTELDQEEVAKIISRYDLLAVPVVDQENVLVGIVTVDDIIDVIREENTEDILKLVGAGEDLLENYSIKAGIINRFPWLIATWIGGLFVMKLVGMFEDQLKQVVLLTAFFPVILGMSGNVGQQSATIIVRGIAIGKVDVSRLTSTVVKETITGLIIGVVYGFMLAGAAWIQLGDDPMVMMLPLVVGLSQCFGMMLAAMVGSFVPMFLSRINIDPAAATGPLVTTSLDILCMGMYFLFASIFIF